MGHVNASNTPFRLFKLFTHAGGISSPFIAHRPAGLSPGAGQKMSEGPISDEHGQLIDLMATFVDVSGATYPGEVNGTRIVPMAGVSLRPVFAGEPLAERPIFFEHEGNRAMYLGDWKLVAMRGDSWSLYRIRDDRTEAVDLASTQPEKIAELVAPYEAWASANNVLPWPVKRGGHTPRGSSLGAD